MSTHPFIPPSNDRRIPFLVAVVDLPDPDTIAARAETLEGVTWSLQRGALFADTVQKAIDLPDAELAALAAAYGFHIPLAILRANPLAVIRDLAWVTALPATIPRCLRETTARTRA